MDISAVSLKDGKFSINTDSNKDNFWLDMGPFWGFFIRECQNNFVLTESVMKGEAKPDNDEVEVLEGPALFLLDVTDDNPRVKLAFLESTLKCF